MGSYIYFIRSNVTGMHSNISAVLLNVFRNHFNVSSMGSHICFIRSKVTGIHSNISAVLLNVFLIILTFLLWVRTFALSVRT